MPANSSPYQQTENQERLRWDKEAYEARSHARAQAVIDAATTTTTGGIGPPPPTGETTAGEKRPAHAIALSDTVEKEEFQKATPGAQGPLNSQWMLLKPRWGKVDLDSKIGSTEIINPDAISTALSIVYEGVGGVAVSLTQGMT